MNYTVYVHTNKINNKKYVGITSQKPQWRWNNVKAAAAKCKSKMDFKKRFGVAYKMACKFGITNDLNFNN